MATILVLRSVPSAGDPNIIVLDNPKVIQGNANRTWVITSTKEGNLPAGGITGTKNTTLEFTRSYAADLIITGSRNKTLAFTKSYAADLIITSTSKSYTWSITRTHSGKLTITGILNRIIAWGLRLYQGTIEIFSGGSYQKKQREYFFWRRRRR